MDIGQALAEARSQAGLTVEDVSERTRIRRTIITDIERDDYSACGGDFYARGHIRAIAKVVGTDPVPLIERYDELTAQSAAEAAAGPGRPVTGPDPETWWQQVGQADSGTWRQLARGPQTKPQPPVRPASANGAHEPLATEPDTQPQPAVAPEAETVAAPDLDTPAPSTPVPSTGAPSTPVPGSAVPSTAVSAADLAAMRRAAARGAAAARRSAGGGMASARAGAAVRALREAADDVRQAAAEAARRAAARLSEQGPGGPARDGTRPGAGVAGGTTSAAGFRQATAEAVQRIRNTPGAGRRLSVVVGGVVILLAALVLVIYALTAGPAHGAGAGPAASRHGVPAGGKHVASPAASKPAAPSGSPAAAVPVTPVSAAAFGPGGTSHGDNPQQASFVLSGRGGGWNSNWYTTAQFGGLQSGTGLLLDLGRSVSVTGVTIGLGSASGGALQLRAGDSPSLAGLPVVASAADNGGTVTVSLHQPVAARYLLVWFTRLPADSSGTYQATIYHVSVTAAG